MSHHAYRPEEVMPHPSPAPDTESAETGDGAEEPRIEDPSNRDLGRAASVTHPLGPRARRIALSLSEL